jgi:hypothetical protein
MHHYTVLTSTPNSHYHFLSFRFSVRRYQPMHTSFLWFLVVPFHNHVLFLVRIRLFSFCYVCTYSASSRSERTCFCVRSCTVVVCSCYWLCYVFSGAMAASKEVCTVCDKPLHGRQKIVQCGGCDSRFHCVFENKRYGVCFLHCIRQVFIPVFCLHQAAEGF